MPGYPRGPAVSFIAVLVSGLISCDPASAPSSPPPPPPTRSLLTLSGMVFDYTSDGSRPGANVPLLVHVGNSNVFLEVTSDAMGRYSVSGVPAGTISIAAARGSGYYAPCPAGWDIVQSDRVFDVHVASAALLSTAGAPADMPLSGGIWVSGFVYERTPEGREPIAGATVNLGGDDSDPRVGSTTVTDAAGRYLVCPPIPSTGTDTYGSLRVTREGFQPASGSPFLGWDYTGVDIELLRK